MYHLCFQLHWLVTHYTWLALSLLLWLAQNPICKTPTPLMQRVDLVATVFGVSGEVNPARDNVFPPWMVIDVSHQIWWSFCRHRLFLFNWSGKHPSNTIQLVVDIRGCSWWCHTSKAVHSSQCIYFTISPWYSLLPSSPLKQSHCYDPLICPSLHALSQQLFTHLPSLPPNCGTLSHSK